MAVHDIKDIVFSAKGYRTLLDMQPTDYFMLSHTHFGKVFTDCARIDGTDYCVVTPVAVALPDGTINVHGKFTPTKAFGYQFARLVEIVR